MTLQAQLNQEAIDMLPITKKSIRSGNERHSVLQKICNSSKPISEMTQHELYEFDATVAKYLAADKNCN